MGEFSERDESSAAIENAVFHAVNLEMQLRSGLEPESEFGQVQAEGVEALLSALTPDERTIAEARIEEEVAGLPEETSSERQRREVQERIAELERKVEAKEE